MRAIQQLSTTQPPSIFVVARTRRCPGGRPLGQRSQQTLGAFSPIFFTTNTGHAGVANFPLLHSTMSFPQFVSPDSARHRSTTMLQRGGPIYRYHPYDNPPLRRAAESPTDSRSSSPIPPYPSSWSSQSFDENVNPNLPGSFGPSGSRPETPTLPGNIAGVPLAPMNGTHNREVPAILTPQGLDIHINKMGLSARREDIHQFAGVRILHRVCFVLSHCRLVQMRSDQQNVLLFTMMLANECRRDDGEVLDKISTQLENITRLSEGSWQPTSVQIVCNPLIFLYLTNVSLSGIVQGSGRTLAHSTTQYI